MSAGVEDYSLPPTPEFVDQFRRFLDSQVQVSEGASQNACSENHSTPTSVDVVDVLDRPSFTTRTAFRGMRIDIPEEEPMK